jgi:hypothetical protein
MYKNYRILLILSFLISLSTLVMFTVVNGKKVTASDSVGFTHDRETTIPTPVPISICKVSLRKKRDGTPINPTYFVASGEVVTIAADTRPSNRNIGVECTAIFGKVKYSQHGEIIYTAPKKPGSFDIVTVRAVDKGTGKIVQEIINITIRDKP